VEHSGELGATPASDSRRTAASHLGRAHAGAYRSDSECTGALGGELEALVRSAASGGAFSGNGARRNCCCCTTRAEGGGRGAGDRMDGGLLGAQVGVPTRGVEEAGRGAPNAGVRPPRGRRWLGRGGRPRVGEREAGRAAGWAEREAGLAQQRLSPFPFFFEFLFSNSF